MSPIKYLYRFENSLHALSDSVEQVSYNTLTNHNIRSESSVIVKSLNNHSFIVDIFYTVSDSLFVSFSQPRTNNKNPITYKISFHPLHKVIDTLQSFFILSYPNKRY